MLTVLAIIGGIFVAWFLYNSLSFFHLKLLLREALGVEIAEAILNEEAANGWVNLPSLKQTVALYVYCRAEHGREAAQAMTRKAWRNSLVATKLMASGLDPKAVEDAMVVASLRSPE